MFTIREAADRVGLTPDLLRAWEKRYGVVQPQRSPSGYRLYSEADIAQLEAMRELIDSGWRAREAAGHVLTAAEGRRPADNSAPRGAAEAAAATPDGVDATPASEASGKLQARFVGAAARLDAATLSDLLHDFAAAGRFEVAVETRLFPALRAVGDAWAAGEVSVAGEHVASAAILRWLGQRYDAASRDTARADVVVGLPPGARHELGALAFGVALRRLGVKTIYVGSDLPAADWVEAVSSNGARLAVIGVVMEEDSAAAATVAKALRAAASGVQVAFGGPAAAALKRYGRVLPSGLEDAAEAAKRLLDEPQAGPKRHLASSRKK